MKTVGIYKITSPNDKIYIGQSWDIERRWKDYKNLSINCIGRKLYNSLKKYGPFNFRYEVLCELPEDIDQETMDSYEALYWSQHKLSGYQMLNIRECNGSKGKHSEQTKKRMSLASIGVPKSESHKESLSKAKLEKPVRFWKDKTFSEEHKELLSKAKLGRSTGRLGTKMPSISNSYKRTYTVIVNGKESQYHLSKTDLRKILGLTLTTFNKILSGKTCKKKSKQNISIWQSPKFAS